MIYILTEYINMSVTVSSHILETQCQAELHLLALRSKTSLDYLQGHAHIMQLFLNPRGLGYHMHRQDAQLNPADLYFLSQTLTDLQLPDGQIDPFWQQLIVQVKQAQTAQTIAYSHNGQNFLHILQPCFLNQQLLGVLHFWFPDHHPVPIAVCAKIIQIAAETLSFYLKISQLEGCVQQMAQKHAHLQLLEELAGDLNLEHIGWNIVNYARETLKCSRVCLFKVQSYPYITQAYEMIACSGLKKVNKRSEHAVILTQTAQALIAVAIEKAYATSLPNHTHMADKGIYGLAQRYPAANDQRPPALDLYFERIPMNWVAAVALTDSAHQIAGVLLFEGQSFPVHFALDLAQMRSLAQAAQANFIQALDWHIHYTQQLAWKWEHFFQKWTPSYRRMMAKKWAIGLSIFALVLCFPLPYHLSGVATIQPKAEINLSAMRIGQLVERYREPGDMVQKDELLVALKTDDLEHGIHMAQRKLAQAQAQVGQAQILHDEQSEHDALIAIRSAQAQIEELELAWARSHIYAPMDALLLGPSWQSLKPGSIVAPGEVLATLIDPSSWTVHMQLRQQDLTDLEKELIQHHQLEAQLSLLALPHQSFVLQLKDMNQIFYGKTQEGYDYRVVFDLSIPVEQGEWLRSGYVGEVVIDMGWQTLTHFLFHDFIVFIQTRVF